MSRRREPASWSWGERLAGMSSFDQSNGIDRPPVAEERYDEGLHTVAPERLNHISRHFH